MILATGKRLEQAKGRVGFTLIEIVLVLGLIGVATTVLITNFAAIADRGNSLTTEEVLVKAVRRARFIAASERTITQLHFDKESNNLRISIGSNAVEALPLDESFQETRSAEIRFYLISSAKGLNLPVDAIRTRLEAKMVYFAADRSSSPFVAEIDPGSGTPERLQFDPFSSLIITSK